MLFYFTLIIAVMFVVVETMASKTNKTINAKKKQSEKWHTAYRWRWGLGIPLAIISVFITYPMPGIMESNSVVGFPFIVAVFDESGRDYVGPFSSIFFLGNILIWYFLSNLLLLIWAKYFDNNNENIQ